MEESRPREERNLEAIAEAEETAENGIVCIACKSPFINVNEIYHCPTHREILMHDGCGKCTILGCNNALVSYLGARTSENVAQNINIAMNERNSINSFASYIQAVASSIRNYIRNIRDNIGEIIRDYDGEIIAAGIGVVVLGLGISALIFIDVQQNKDSRKIRYENLMRQIPGQVTNETYQPETDSTREMYKISIQGMNKEYEIIVLNSPTMTKKELADRIRIGDFVNFPQGNVEGDIEAGNETIIEYETDFTPSDTNSGFKRADRIAIASEQRAE